MSQFTQLLLQATQIQSQAFKGADTTNLPQEMIFLNLNLTNANVFNGLNGRRKLYIPNCTTINHADTFAGDNAQLYDLGDVVNGVFYPGKGNSSSLRSTSVPTFSTFNVTNIEKIYVKSDIINDFISTYPVADGITFSIGGTEWINEYGSENEWADYPNGESPFNEQEEE